MFPRKSSMWTRPYFPVHGFLFPLEQGFKILDTKNFCSCNMVVFPWLRWTFYRVSFRFPWYRETKPREIVFSISDFPCYREIMTVVTNTIFFWCRFWCCKLVSDCLVRFCAVNCLVRWIVGRIGKVRRDSWKPSFVKYNTWSVFFFHFIRHFVIFHHSWTVTGVKGSVW